MAELPPVTQEWLVDASSWRKTAEVIAFHMGALAHDLAELEAGGSVFPGLGPIPPVPASDGEAAAKPRPERWDYPVGDCDCQEGGHGG